MYSVLFEPGWLAVLLAWNFAVLSAAQLTIRLIMAYAIRPTIIGAVLLTVFALVVAAVYDLVVGSSASLSTRLAWAPLSMILMSLGGFAVARWVLRIKRTRGQVITGFMVGLLDPHLFTLLFS